MTKTQVVAQCAEFGASVAKIVMANIAGARWSEAATKTGEFIALPLTMAPPPGPPITSKSAGADLHVELHRSATAEFALCGDVLG